MSTLNAIPVAPLVPEEPPRMGSEYADARTYLASVGKVLTPSVRPKAKKTKPHGSNDSDFGFPDQAQD